jgi:hypothetical protein
MDNGPGNTPAHDWLPTRGNIVLMNEYQLLMNEYQVTYSNGEVVEIEAWTPEAAQAIAEEDAEMEGRDLAVTRVAALSREAIEQ